MCTHRPMQRFCVGLRGVPVRSFFLFSGPVFRFVGFGASCDGLPFLNGVFQNFLTIFPVDITKFARIKQDSSRAFNIPN